jgi:hypothetical protein
MVTQASYEFWNGRILAVVGSAVKDFPVAF